MSTAALAGRSVPGPRRVFMQRIRADLAGRGGPVGSHDLWIVATAAAHGFGIAACRAQGFGRITALRLPRLA